MPDNITPVGTQGQYDPTQGIKMLSGVLGLQQQKQQLQIGQARMPGIEAESQQQQQRSQELQRLASFTKDAISSGKYQLADGSPDVQSFQRDAMQVAPTYGQEFIGHTTSNFKEAVGTRAALQGLSSAQNKQISDALKGIATNPNATASDLLDVVSQLRSNNKDPAFNRALDNFVLGANRGNIQEAAATAASALGGLPMGEPGQIDKGGSVQPGAVTTMGPGMGGFAPQGPAVKKTLPPQVVRMPNEQVQVYGEGAGSGAGSGSKPPPHEGPRTAADDAPPANAPKQIQDRFNDATKAAAAHQTETHESDATYGTNMSITQSIRHLVEGGTKSGPGTAEYNKLVGTFATRFGGLKGVSDSQLLGAYMDRQSALLRSQMGLPETNAGQATAASISGNTEYNPAVITEKNNLNEALAEGLHQYRQGLDRVAGFSGSPSPKAVGAFRSAWAENFDPAAEAYRLALRRGDTEAANAIKSRYSPEQLKDLARKGRNMDLLSQGKMPNG